MAKKYSRNPQFQMNPKSQIWEGSSWELKKNDQKIFDFSEGHNFSCQKNLGVVAYIKAFHTTRP